MVATKPSNTQVYSPFGSFVVEQHDEPGRCDAVTPHHETTRRYDTGRYDTIKRHYVDDDCRSEKGIAIIWTLLIAGFLVGAVYSRLGKPDLVATSQAEASMNGTQGSGSGHAKEREAD